MLNFVDVTIYLPHSTTFHRMNPRNRHPARRAHLIFQLAHMFLTLLHHFRRPQHRLCGKFHRNISMNAHSNTAICQRIYEQIDLKKKKEKPEQFCSV